MNMKKFLFVLIYICLITLIIPLLAVKLSINTREKEKYINVYIKSEDKTEKMEISQYIKEVVAAEMPAEFELEALKAQAVATRTYMINRRDNPELKKEHKRADICTDSTHCKAWKREEDCKKGWDEDKKDEYWGKISRAADETENEILVFDGKPINAVFHSTSSGNTENAKDVWGEEVPYLISVESEGDLQSPKYKSEFICSTDEYKEKIIAAVKDANPDGELFSDIKRSEAGGIITLKVLGIEIKGTEFRKIFDLRSTNVQPEIKENKVHMQVLGYGHGVGMSQYGAQYMASMGSTYKEILLKYYTGTDILKQ